MNDNETAFKSVMSRFASGVTVVTLDAGDGPRGLTVSAFCSLSLKPLLVLVCIDQRASIFEPLHRAEGFCVNILGEDQKQLSNWFAGPAKGAEDPFADIPTEIGTTGSPIIKSCLAFAECVKQDRYPGGDHDIFVGRVIRAEVLKEEAPPLLYYRSAYRTIDFTKEAP